MIDIDKIVFRASSMGDLMGVKGLGDTGMKKARYTYLEDKYGRVKEFTSKYTEKGNSCEEESIRILSQIDGVEYTKNEERKTNDYFTGECDIKINRDVKDVKNCWDLFTFHDACAKFDAGYEWQGRVYMNLFDCDTFELVYMLNDAPDELVLKALESESYKHADRENPEWREVQIIQSMIFTQENFDRFITIRGLGGDELTDKLISLFVPIPQDERIKRYQFKAESEKLVLMQNRVIEAREYLKKHYAATR